MNKKKFNLKCQELKTYEENVLTFIKEHFSDYGKKLIKKDLALDIELLFNERPFEKEMSFERIDFSTTYTCFLSICIRKNTDPYKDLDLNALFFPIMISQIGRTFFLYTLKFGRCPEKYLKTYITEVEECIYKVLNEGYDKILKELNINKNN